MERSRPEILAGMVDLSSWQLRENPTVLHALYETMLKAADFGGGMKQQAATLGYQLYNIATLARCWFSAYEGELPVLVMRYQTRKERERAFFLGHDKDILITALEAYGRRRKENGAEDCRVVVPFPLFVEEDLPSLLGTDWRLKNQPIMVCRAYVDKESLVKIAGTLPPDYRLSCVQPQDSEAVLRLYDQNYLNHSFDPARLKGGSYQGVRDSADRWVSACGTYDPFFVNEFGFVTISSDLVVAKQERERDLGIRTYFAVIQDALAASLTRPGSQIVIADCINEKSVAMAKRLGFREANWNWWTVYKRK